MGLMALVLFLCVREVGRLKCLEDAQQCQLPSFLFWQPSHPSPLQLFLLAFFRAPFSFTEELATAMVLGPQTCPFGVWRGWLRVSGQRQALLSNINLQGRY